MNLEFWPLFIVAISFSAVLYVVEPKICYLPIATLGTYYLFQIVMALQALTIGDPWVFYEADGYLWLGFSLVTAILFTLPGKLWSRLRG